MSKTIAKINTGNLGTSSGSNPASAFTPKSQTDEEKRKRAQANSGIISTGIGRSNFGASASGGHGGRVNAREEAQKAEKRVSFQDFVSDPLLAASKLEENLLDPVADAVWRVVSPNAAREADEARAKENAAMPEAKKPKLGKAIEGVFTKGADQAVSGVTSTMDWLLGGALKDLGWENNPISAWNRAAQANREANEIYYGKNMANASKAGKTIEELGTSAVAAIPDMIIAMMLGGTNLAAKGSGALARGGMKLAGSEMAMEGQGLLRRAVDRLYKDPQFWTSFSRVAGPSYDQAKADGASEWAANMYALSNGIMNAAVEVGGGIQKLPEKLQNGGKALLNWITSNAEEGTEEVVQGVIGRGLENLIYGKGNQLFSVEDENAVFNPVTSAKEFGGGFGVGALLGGGPAIVNVTNNVKQDVLERQIGDANTIAENVNNVNTALSMPKGSMSRTVADRIATKMQKGEKITNSELGKLTTAMIEDARNGVEPVAEADSDYQVAQTKGGGYELVMRLGPIAENLQTKGLSAKEAVTLGNHIETLLNSDELSDSQIKTLAMNAAAREVFTEMTGKEVLEQGRPRELRDSLKYAAAEYREEQAVAKQERAEAAATLAEQGHELAEVQQMYDDMSAEFEQKAQEQAAQEMESAISEAESQSAEQTEQDTSALKREPALTREQFAEQWAQDLRARTGIIAEPEQVEAAWQEHLAEDGVLLDDGRVINKERFFKETAEFYANQKKIPGVLSSGPVKLSEKQLQEMYEAARMASRENPLDSRAWKKEDGDTQDTQPKAESEVTESAVTEPTVAEKEKAAHTNKQKSAQKTTKKTTKATAKTNTETSHTESPAAIKAAMGVLRKSGATNFADVFSAEKSGELEKKIPVQKAFNLLKDEGIVSFDKNGNIVIDEETLNMLTKQTSAKSKANSEGRHSVPNDELGITDDQLKNEGVETTPSVSREQLITVLYLKPYLNRMGIKNVRFVGDKLGAADGQIVGDTIYINENLADSADLVAKVIGHEVVHPATKRTRKESGDENVSVAEDIIDLMQDMNEKGLLKGEDGEFIKWQIENLDKITEERRERYTKFYESLGYNSADIAHLTTDAMIREEIAADWMGYTLRNTNILDKLAGVKADPLTWAIRTIDRIRGQEYNGLLDTNSKDYKDAAKAMDNLAKNVYAALDRANREKEAEAEKAKTFETAKPLEVNEPSSDPTRVEATMIEEMGDGTFVEANEDGEFVFAENKDDYTTAFSLPTWQEGKAKLRAALEGNGHEEDEIEDVIKRIDDVADFLKDLGEEYAGLGYNNLKTNLYATILTDVRTHKQVLHTLVKNGDYPVNLDLALVCKKRVAYMQMLGRLIQDGVFDKINFNGSAIAKVNEILRDEGFETACLGCFVESRRLQIQGWAETIVNEWNKAVDARRKNAPDFGFASGESANITEEEILEIEKAYGENTLNDQGNIKLGNKAVEKKMGDLLDKVPSLRKHLTVEDLITPKGITALRQNGDGTLFSLVKQRYGAASPKIVQEFNPYNSEIADLTFAFAKELDGDGISGGNKYVTDAKNELGAPPIRKNDESEAEYNERYAEYTRMYDKRSRRPKKARGESREGFERRKERFEKEAETKAMRQYLYDIGGARMQSFSDFMIENVLDYVQMYADLAAKEFPMHGYTKETTCLRLFGMTGAKWNGSLIAHTDPALGKGKAGLLPVEEASNGRGVVVTDPLTGEQYAICFDDYERHKATGSFIQSIGFKDVFALQLDPRYSANVGSITIGVSDAQIRAMLNHPLFSMVIPYHKSGMIKEYAALVGVDTYNDYTDYQNTTVKEVYNENGEKVEAFYKLDKDGKKKYIHADTHYDFNAAVQRNNGDAKAAAQEYLDWCADASQHPVVINGETVGYEVFNPKFSDSPEGYNFAYDPDTGEMRENYYKLLEDFTSYDSVTGDAARQGAVQMNFPTENGLTAEQLKEYKQSLRDTGIFSGKEIEKYAKKAQMGFKDIVREAVGERAEYQRKTEPKWEETVAKVEDALLSDESNRSTPEERQAIRDAKKFAPEEDADDDNRFSIPVTPQQNAEYMAAVERGDTKTAQKMVDEAAKRAGYDIRAYHGTKAEFTAFDKSRFGKNYGGFLKYGDGFYFALNNQSAERWAGKAKADGEPRVMPVFLSSQRMLNVNDPVDSPAAAEYLKSIGIDRADINWYLTTGYRFIEAVKYREGQDGIQKVLESLSYDGIADTLSSEHGQYVVFNPEQVKSADPVTYDDDGNVIPLSERFNPKQSDIRYSLPSNADEMDRQYMDAVEKGDMEVAQAMVDEAARRAGYPKTAFHGTLNGGFTEFDKHYAHLNGNSGAGFYFSSNRSDSESHYADVEGADNYFKARNLAEQIMEMGEWNDEPIEDFDEALAIAKKELVKNPQVYNVFLDLGKTFVRHGRFGTNILDDLMVGFDGEEFDLASYNGEEDDYNDDGYWRVSNHVYPQIYSAVREAFDATTDRYEVMGGDTNLEELATRITNEALDRDYLNWDTIYGEVEDLMIDLLAPDESEVVNGSAELTRAIIEAFGYDSITDKDVVWKFNQVLRMGDMGNDTEHYIMFRPEQIKSSDPVTYDDDGKAIPLSERFNFDEPDIRYSIPQPVPGMYNLSERVLANVKQEKLGAASAIPMLRGKGVKAEEIKWLGIEDFLKGKKSVTKQELLDYIRANDLQIEEETLESDSVIGNRSERSYPDEWELVDVETGEVYRNAAEAFEVFTERLSDREDFDPENIGFDESDGVYYEDPNSYDREILAEFSTDHYESEDGTQTEDETRWSEYTTPGGSNYREIVFRLPGSEYFNNASEVHWKDKAPGVFAHARVQDFTDTQGRDVLFIDEIQSDWHNEGGKKGYNARINVEKAKADFESAREERRELRGNTILKAAKEKISQTFLLPEDPVRRHYALDSRLLDGALANEGLKEHLRIYNSNHPQAEVNLSSSEIEALQKWQDAERKYTQASINYNAQLTAVPDAPFANNYTDFVLKRMLREAAENGYDGLAWTTADMQADRWSDEYMEGYRIEYDQDIPKFLNKFGKKFGAKVGTTKLDSDGETIRVPFIPITDEMRQSVMTEGMPRFSLPGENPFFDEYMKQLSKEMAKKYREDNPPVERQSQTNSTNGLLTDEEKQELNLTPPERTHIVVPDEGMEQIVGARLDADYDKEKRTLFRKGKKWNAADTATAEEIIKREVEKARETGDNSEVRRLMRMHDAQMSDWGLTGHTAREFGSSFAATVADAMNILDAAAEHEAKNKGKKNTANRVVKDTSEAGKDALGKVRDEMQAATGEKPNPKGVIPDKKTYERNKNRKGTAVDSNMVNEPFTFEYADAVGTAMANSIANRGTQREQSKTFLKQLQGEIMRFANERLPARKNKTKPTTATELLKSYVENRKFFDKAWEAAGDELRRKYGDEIPGGIQSFLRGWYGLSDGALTSNIMKAAIVSSAVATEETANLIRKQAAVGSKDIGKVIADDLIAKTGAKGELANMIRAAADFYVDDIVGRQKAGSTDKRRDNLINNALREIGKAIDAKAGPTSMGKLGSTSAASKAVVRDAVINTLIEKYAVSEADAERVADVVGNRFDTLLREGMEKRLASMFKDKDNVTPKKQKAFLDRLIELTNLGAMESQDYHDAAVAKLMDGYTTRRGVTTDEVLKKVYDYATKAESVPKGDIKNLKALVSELNAERWTGGLRKGDEIHRTLQKAIDKVASQPNGEQFLRDLIAAQIRGIANDNSKLTATETLGSLRYLSMLSKLTTVMRNLIGNTAFDLADTVSVNAGVPFDWVLSKVTGRRTTTVDKSVFSDVKRKGMIDAATRAYIETALDAPIEDGTNRWEMRDGRTFKMAKRDDANAAQKVGNSIERFFSTMEKWQRYLLTVSDEFYKGGTRDERQRQIDSLKARGLLEEDALMDDAQQLALERTFQNQGLMAQGVGALRNVGDLIGFRDYKGNKFGLGSAVMPFARVPANLVGQVFNYSPLGLAKALGEVGVVVAQGKNATAEMQARAVRDIGRGLNGTTLIGLLTVAAMRGLMSVAGAGSGDDDEKALERDMGKTGTQLNLSALQRWIRGESTDWKKGDQLLSIGGIEPLNGPMAFAGLLAASAETDAGVLARIVNGNFQTAMQALSELPAMSTINNIVNAYKYSDEKYDQELNPNGGPALQAADAAAQGLGDIAASFIPNVLSGIAQGMDEGTVRTTRTSDKRGLKAVPEETLNAFKLKIPGLRSTLPEALDSFGQPRQSTASVGQNWLNSNVMPLAINSFKPNPVSQELLALREAGEQVTMPPRNAVKSVNTENGNKKLTESERRQYQQTVGSNELMTMTDAMNDPNYRNAPDDVRAQVWANLKSYSTAAGKQIVGGNSKIPSWAGKYTGTIADRAIAAAFFTKAKNDANLDDNPTNAELIGAVANSGMSADMQDMILQDNISEAGMKKYRGAREKGISAQTYVMILEATTKEKMPANGVSGAHVAKVKAYLNDLVKRKVITQAQMNYLLTCNLG